MSSTGKGAQVRRGRCATDPAAIEEAIRLRADGPARVGLEAGPLTPWLVHGLRGRGLEVVRLDARQARAALAPRPDKTDANDAEGIAKLMVSGRNEPAGRSRRNDARACHPPRIPLPGGDYRPRRWLHRVFSLSLRDVELILAERGIGVTHGGIRKRCLRFGAGFARRLRGRRPRPGSTWHLGEVFLRVDGALHHLWRAVGQDGVVLDILVQGRQNAAAAKRFFKRLLAGLKYEPKRIVTGGPRSYGAAGRGVLPEVPHRASRCLNNRAESSHRPTRRRERQTQRFKPPGQAQRFLAAHAMIHGHFRPRRHLMSADQYCRARAEAFRIWRRETCVRGAA